MAYSSFGRATMATAGAAPLIHPVAVVSDGSVLEYGETIAAAAAIATEVGTDTKGSEPRHRGGRRKKRNANNNNSNKSKNGNNKMASRTGDTGTKSRSGRDKVLYGVVATVVAVVAVLNRLVFLTTYNNAATITVEDNSSSTGEDPGFSAVNDIEKRARRKPSPSGNPCSSYENVVYITEDDGDIGTSNFCNRKLLENTAYIVTDDVVCDDDWGPELSSGTCLDCGGHSIRGGINNDGRGITVPTAADNSFIHNCLVEQFKVGIMLEGDDNVVSNVQTSRNEIFGIRNFGRNNAVQCSVSSDNKWCGISSADGDIEISGCLSERNGRVGALLDERVDMSCNVIRSNDFEGITTGPHHDVVIRDTALYNNGDINAVFYGNGTASMIDVAFRNDAGRGDIRVWGDGKQSFATKNLICDNVKVQNKPPPGPYKRSELILCDVPFPAGDFAPLELPDGCNDVCRAGRGTYTHM